MALTTNNTNYWKFEDTSDSVGSATLTNNGTVTFSAGKKDNCAVFNGSSQYFSFTPLGLSNTTFTIAGWFKLGTDKNGSIYQEGISGNNNPYVAIQRGGATGADWVLVARDASATGLARQFTSDVTRNVWHHFCWAMTASVSTLYVDGVLVDTTSFTANSFTANVGRIGSAKRVNEEAYFGGSLDEMAVWSRTLSADEASQLFNSGRGNFYTFTDTPSLYGCVAYYKLDETSGNAADSIGSNTLTNDNVTYVTGKINNGADLEKDSTAVFTTTTTPVTGTGDKTISVWCKPESFSANGNIVIAIGGQSNHNQINLGFSDNGKAYAQLYGGGGFARASSASSTGTWLHAVAVYKTSGFIVYVNGSEVATGSANSMNVSGTNGNIFGNYTDYDTNWGYDGLIDEVGIFNRALSSTEVTLLYNSGDGRQWPFNVGDTYTLVTAPATFTDTTQAAGTTAIRTLPTAPAAFVYTPQAAGLTLIRVNTAPLLTFRSATTPFSQLSAINFYQLAPSGNVLPVLAGETSEYVKFRIYNNYDLATYVASALNVRITTYDGLSSLSRTSTQSTTAQQWVKIQQTGFGESSATPIPYTYWKSDEVAVGGLNNVFVQEKGTDGSTVPKIRAGTDYNGCGFLEVQTRVEVPSLAAQASYTFAISVMYEWVS
jgi:hypothetical protein